jgi:hypothetical protein
LDRKVLENNFSHTTADHYKTALVPEFARDYQEKWDKSQLICDVNDMLPIAMAKLNLKITAVHR